MKRSSATQSANFNLATVIKETYLTNKTFSTTTKAQRTNSRTRRSSGNSFEDEHFQWLMERVEGCKRHVWK